MKKTVQELKEMKGKEKISVLTCYDYSFAKAIDGLVDIILVGDSVGNVVYGYTSTREVIMYDIVKHISAVRKGVSKSLIVGDMPFESYQRDIRDALKNAQRFIDEAGCNAVKLEWFERCPEVARRIVEAGVPVMGHVGLTPQTAVELGGFKVQGRNKADAARILDQAKDLEAQGCFAVVLECIPEPLAKIITEALNIPTIGIGAGVHCDGQVLVLHDEVHPGGVAATTSAR